MNTPKDILRARRCEIYRATVGNKALRLRLLDMLDQPEPAPSQNGPEYTAGATPTSAPPPAPEITDAFYPWVTCGYRLVRQADGSSRLEWFRELVHMDGRCEPFPESQVARLAAFIVEEIPGEPSRSEGAVDTAIRIMRQQKRLIDLFGMEEK